MPQKIMASPNNVYNFYDSYVFDVEVRHVNESQSNCVTTDGSTGFECNHATYSRDGVENGDVRFVYVDLKTRQEINVPNFIPLHRQVSGVGSQEDIGFDLLDQQRALEESGGGIEPTYPPVLIQGEKYYVRVSGEEGTAVYDTYAADTLPLVFSKLRWDGAVRTIDRISIYYSTKGAVTNLHYDESPIGAVVCQLLGRKKIALWPPGFGDEKESKDPSSPSQHHEDIIRNGRGVMKGHPDGHPLTRRSLFTGRDPHYSNDALKKRMYLESIMLPGQCVYMPVGWWHYIESMDNSTISIRFNVPQ